VVIKGGARSGAAELAAHLQRLDTNERAVVQELRGVAAQDLDGALLEMEAVSLGSRSRRHFYHVSINTRADEVMTPGQWMKAVNRLEKELKLTDQPRAVVFHVKEGRAHVHVVWSRIDLDSMTAISDSHNYRRHELVSRELEREFGHVRVQGAHIERDGGPRPDRTHSHAELQQADRHRLTPEQASQTLTEIWNRTDRGKAFAAAIAAEGWTLARGDKRDFVVLDPAGGVHSLSRRIEGAKAKDIRARMADLDATHLPSVAEAKATVRARVQEQQRTVAGQSETADRPVEAKPQRDTDDEKRREERGEPAIATSNASMVAQQREAQQRFERNSADLETQRKARLKRINDAIEQQGKRDRQDNPAVNRERPKGGLER
jgi:Relaxase/Mobilisation nuclease domain